MNTEICRICLLKLDLQKEDLFTCTFNFVELESSRVKISDAVMECTSVNISPDDGYTKLICMACVQNLLTSYIFRQKCIVSDARLKETTVTVTTIELSDDDNVPQDTSIKLEKLDEDKLDVDTYLNDISCIENKSNLNEINEEIEVTCSECNTMCFNLENHVCLEFVCSKCPRVFKEKNAKDKHEEEHNQDIVGSYCGFCKVEFTSMEKYETHRIEICSFQRSIDDMEPPYVCTSCQKIFTSKILFQIHLQIHSSVRLFECSKYPTLIKQNSHLNIHLRTHIVENPGLRKTPNKKHVISKHENVSKNPPLNLINEIDKKQFPCTHCDKIFPSKSTFSKHQPAHSKERPYVCEICAKGFKQESYLKSHRMIHTQEKNFKCPYCDRAFITNTELRKHIFRRHPDSPMPPKQWNCRSCKDTFQDRAEFVAHLKQHYRAKMETNMICEECGKVCKNRVLLSRHRKLHEGFSHSCSKCPKKFMYAQELKRHELCHSDEKPHKCDQCGQRFKWKISLWRHENRHKGARSKKCKFCDKAFIEEGPLKRHMRVHTEERPQKCQICYRTFKETTHLKTHVLRVHYDKSSRRNIKNVNVEKISPSIN